MIRRLWIVLFILLAGSITRGQTPAPAGQLSLDDFIKELTAEAETLNKEGSKLQARRPHRSLAKLQPDLALKVLARLTEPFTNDPIRDAYIKYHLICIPLQDGNSKKELSSKKFADIATALPPEIPWERKPNRIIEDREAYAQYKDLMRQCRVVTGFPPFEKITYPPESFEFMDGDKRRAAEAKYAEAQSLLGKFKVTLDKDALAYNDGMQWINFMNSQVRGDAIYGMLMTGDPKALEMMVGLISRQANSNAEMAAEMLAFVNAAYFDGWLGQYPEAKLKTAAASLKNIVTGADRSADPKARSESRRKSLSELAFTIITSMEMGSVPNRTENPQLTRRTSRLPPFKKRQLTPQTLDLDTINDAIERGIAALEEIRPPDTVINGLSYNAIGMGARSEFSLPGHQGLADWAMLSCGESNQALWMQKRVNWLACMESIGIYDRAMRLNAMGLLPYKRWEKWIRRDVDWLESAMTDKGNFNTTFPPGEKAKGYGDNANGQYALLGFWAAERAGYPVDSTIWKRIDEYWREAQFPKGNDGAGWATKSYKALTPKDDPKAFANRVAGPMTAAGVLTLSVTERYLLGPKMLGTGNKMSEELSNGLKWLDNNYSIKDIDGDSDLYYYLWTIQNVGQATGYRTFNKTDWFREATADLLNQQSPDGQWKGPKGPIVSTSFALMYLARARGPLAICKVRFESDDAKADPNRWNNRPNDMVNFTDYVSQQFETPTSWQIADLDQPVYELIESATLYLATDKPFTLKEQQVARLRDYINAGGMIILAPEGTNTSGPVKSMKALAGQLYPQGELKKVDAKHPFFNLFQKVSTPPTTLSIDNGIRPLVVLVEKDISRELQANSAKSRDAFNLLANMYLFATGKDAKRARLRTNYVINNAKDLKTTVRVARIKYDGAFDPEPLAMPQLQALLGTRHGINLELSTVDSANLANEQFAFLTTSATGKLSETESTALRKWIDAGGTLWLDAAAGALAAANEAEAMLTKLGYSSADLVTLSDSPIITGKTLTGGYDNTSLSFRPHEGERPPVRAILNKDRPAVLITRGDICSGLAGVNHAQIAGPSVTSSRQLVINSILTIVKPTQPTSKPAIQPAKR